jgi:hypothetical protein
MLAGLARSFCATCWLHCQRAANQAPLSGLLFFPSLLLDELKPAGGLNFASTILGCHYVLSDENLCFMLIVVVHPLVCNSEQPSDSEVEPVFNNAGISVCSVRTMTNH